LAFWLVAGGMTLAALAFVLARLVFPRHLSPHVEPREANLAALRSARAELDRDLAVGLISPAAHESAREELTQRAAEELDEGSAPVPTRPSWAAAAAFAVIVPVAAFAFYGQVGSPDAIHNVTAFKAIDGTLTADRLPQLREQLARHVADHPKDGRAWALLGRASLAMDRFADAERAFAMAVHDRKVARDPGVWCDYADAAALAQGGRLEGRPAQFIARALELDAAHPQALEMAGSLAIEKGDYAGAARQWRLLLDRLAADDPRRDELARAVSRVEKLAAPGMT
jgi:cytochrome c-type biogenesis protein CcmH